MQVSAGAEAFYALTYDLSVCDWPGELDFYQRLAQPVMERGGQVLELACGTGRVALRLAQHGVKVTGLEISARMLAAAREKAAGLPTLRLVQGDMRAFDLHQRFDLLLIPGHSFQFMTSPQDQLACLDCIRRHLLPGGLLVMHLDYPDLPWLASLLAGKGGVFQAAESFIHPTSGNRVQARRAWELDEATQTAIVATCWDELDETGRVINTICKPPARLHVIFPFEVEHLLRRTGFNVEAAYGDFFGAPLQQGSPAMIYVAAAAPE